MSGQELRARQRIAPEVARQFIEPVAWTGAATMPDDLAQAHELARQALALRQRASYAEAMAAYDAALARFRASPTVARLDLARLLFDRASCLHRMRKPELFPDALAGYAEALARLREEGDRLAVADCLLNTGACYDDWDNDQKPLRAIHDLRPLARHYYTDGLALYEQTGTPDDIAWALMLRGNFLGKWAREAGQPPLRDEAIADLERALKLLPETEPIARAQALLHLGNCLNEANQFSKAVRLQLQACELLRATGAAGEDRLRAAIHTLANWYFLRDDPDAAWPYITEAAALAERLAQRAGHRAQVIDRRVQVLSSYQLAIRIALKRGDPASAYAYAQRAKGRTLFDLLDRGDGNEATGRAFGLTAPPSLAEIGQALLPGEALLDVHTLDKQGSLVAFLILPGATTVAWHREIAGATVNGVVSQWRAASDRYRDAFDRFRQRLDAPDLAARQSARYLLDRSAAADEQPALEALGAELIDPVLPVLAEQGVTTLILSPSEPLHQLPLPALRVGLEDEERGYLIDRFALSLTPSAAMLARRTQSPPRAIWPPVLVAAAPFCRVNDLDAAPAPMQIHELAARDLAPRDRAGGGAVGLDTLAPLNRSGDEIRGIAAIVQEIAPDGPAPRLYLGAQATRSALVREMPAARFIHLSTHGGKIDLRHSIDDYTLFLAPDGDARMPSTLTVQEVFDGAVTLDDVFAIALSACHLGDAATQGAEAIGFAQAFLAAGAGVILAPIWAVADLPTALLMIGWYTQLASPGRPDVAHAWQAAVQQLRRRRDYDNLFAHPHFWAGFLPTGDGALRLGVA